MSALRKPSLGPIVGHTTDTTSRIWIRGADLDDREAYQHSNHRTVGLIALTEFKGRAIQNPDIFYFRLHRKNDSSGTFTLGEDTCIKSGSMSQPLTPNMAYTARVGTLIVDGPFNDNTNVPDAELAAMLPDKSVCRNELLALGKDRSTATFHTFAAKDNGPGELSFIFGSCRYQGIRTRIKSDEIFGPLLREAEGNGRSGSNRSVQFVLMAGDQIYADKFSRHIPVGRADTPREFQQRYFEAFGTGNMRRLLSRVPTYMILDDHEIEDNWIRNRTNKHKKQQLFDYAKAAYANYQWRHSPHTFQECLYYSFECNGYPFFVLDTRTQRYMDESAGNLLNNHLLGRPVTGYGKSLQLNRFLFWLIMQQKQRRNTPKFVVTPSAFAPNTKDARESRDRVYVPAKTKARWKMDSDSWPAFPETRRAILKCIIENEVQNVVFLSGDIHCSTVAALEFSGSEKAGKLKALSVASSAFYWPILFFDGKPSDFVHNSKQQDQADTFEIDADHTMDYRAWNFTQEDNFCRVDVNPKTHTLTVTAMDKRGEIIRNKDSEGRAMDEKIIAELELAPGW